MINKNWFQRIHTTRSELFKEFASPQHEYRPYAFWFWIDDQPDPENYRNQARRMPLQGMSAGYVHDRGFISGQSEQYYQCLDAAVQGCKRAGLSMGYCDPVHYHRSDELLEGHPELEAVSLRCRMQNVAEGESIIPDDAFFIVGAQLVDNSLIDSETLRFVEPGSEFTAADGTWRLFSFTKYTDVSMEGSPHNYLHHGISQRQIELFHDTVFERYASELGKTISGFFYDLEGDYGYKFCWSEDLENEYYNRTGRNMQLYAPLLFEKDIQGKWMRARYDWFDAVSEVYTEFVFAAHSKELEKHDLFFTTHLWEEHLLGQSLLSGDPMRIYRAVTLPGIDHLGTDPWNVRSYKEVQSVCEFEERRFMCEILGCAGWETTPMDMKKSSNNALAMGVSQFVPHGVYSRRDDISKARYAPDFFDWPPTWEWMNVYTDYAARGSYLISQGMMSADVLLYNPIESVWALLGDGAFDDTLSFSKRWTYDRPNLPDCFEYGEEIQRIDGTYIRAINELSDMNVGFLIADAHYLNQAKIEGSALCIGNRRFSSLILPSVRLMKRSMMEKLIAFMDAGGHIIYTGTLPDASAEQGLGDPVMLALSERLRAHANSVFAPEGLQTLDLPRLLRFDEGEFRIHAQKRLIDGSPFYYLPNNTDEAHIATLFFPDAHGRAVVWNLETGTQQVIASVDSPEGSHVHLLFDEGAGFFLEFDVHEPAYCTAHTEAKRMIALDGEWQIRVDPAHQTENPTGFDLGVPAELIQGVSSRLLPWSEMSMPNFSGCAEYDCEFELPHAVNNLRVDLGEVRYMAAASLDGGVPIQRFWGPYHFDFGSMDAGKHHLHVRVGNLMINHLEPHHMKDGKKLWARWNPTEEHFTSGLLGPVYIEEN